MIARRTVAKAALAAALLGQRAFASEEEAPWDVLVAGSGATASRPPPPPGKRELRAC